MYLNTDRRAKTRSLTYPPPPMPMLYRHNPFRKLSLFLGCLLVAQMLLLALAVEPETLLLAATEPSSVSLTAGLLLAALAVEFRKRLRRTIARS